MDESQSKNRKKERIQEKALMRNFHKISTRSKMTMSGQCPQGCNADRTIKEISRRRVVEREEWRHLSREARAPEGAVAPYVDGRNTKVIKKCVKNMYVNLGDPLTTE